MILAAIAAMISCVGQKDDPQLGSSDFVKLTPDLKQIDVDNSDTATFVVTANGTNVTQASCIINTTNNASDTLKNVDGSYAYLFATTVVGNYTFKAVYGVGKSETVTLRAISSSTQQMDKFYRRSAVYKFTGTWCKYCPDMGDRIKDVIAARPGRLVELSVHNNDVLKIPMGDQLSAYISASALPEVMIDYRNKTKVTVRSTTALTSEIDRSIAANPTVAGVKMSVLRSGDNLDITTGCKVMAGGQYNIVVAVIIDGYALLQTGAPDLSYRQNAVLTQYLCSNMMGDDLGQMAAGEEKMKSYTYGLPGGADVTRYRVVALVLNKAADGIFYANNVIECNVGESTQYEYEQAAI